MTMTSTCAKRPRKRMDDELFERGNEFAWRDSCNNNGRGAAILCWTNKDDCPKIVDNNNDKDAEKKQVLMKQPKDKDCAKIPCVIPNCREMFESTMEMERHYHAVHEWICDVCQSFWECQEWLDLHLLEIHDVYYWKQQQQTKPWISCLFCSSKFFTVEERWTHLQQEHGFPKWFSHQLLLQGITTNNNVTKKKTKYQVWCEKRQRGRKPTDKENNSICNRNVDTTMTTTMGHNENSTLTTKTKNILQDDDNDQLMMEEDAETPPIIMEEEEKEGVYCQMITSTKQDDKLARKRQRRQQRRAQTPCKFFARGESCWRGDACRFMHQTNNRTDNDNMVLDDLADHLQQSLTMVPRQISFGRRRRR